MRRRVEMVLHLIDYLLLNATVLGLEDHGLNAVVRSDIHVMFHRLASSNDLSEAVYEWSSRLTVFLRAAGSSLTKTEVARAVDHCRTRRPQHCIRHLADDTLDSIGDNRRQEGIESGLRCFFHFGVSLDLKSIIASITHRDVHAGVDDQRGGWFFDDRGPFDAQTRRDVRRLVDRCRDRR